MSRRETFTGDPNDIATALLGPGEHANLIRTLGATALVVVPLTTGAHVFAALSLISRTPGRYGAIDPVLLDDVARRFGLAIDRARLYRETQEANRLKDEFLATLSHELRTPLNAILGWARILRTRQLDHDTNRAAEVIERNAEALTRLVEDLLDVSRIVTGKLTLNEQPIDLPVVVGAALDSIRPAARAKGIQLVQHIGPIPPVSGDEHRLQQVFWNLLSNAVKFTGSGGTVTVALKQTGNTVTTTVSDTGIGIRRDVLPFVFDRFRQADASTTRPHGGLGLGLAIVRHIVESHGGSVTVQSVEGKGASFAVELPGGAWVRDIEESRSSGHASGSIATGVTLLGKRVLIVEDDPDARDLVAEIIRAEGGVALGAASTRDALEAMIAFEPDALISDIGLPREDGYELIRRIRERVVQQKRPVAVALTGYARAEDRAQALAAGYQEHIAKPVEPLTLIRVVRTLLDAKK